MQNLRDYRLDKSAVIYVLEHYFKVAGYFGVFNHDIIIDQDNFEILVDCNFVKIRFRNFQYFKIEEILEGRAKFQMSTSIDGVLVFPSIIPSDQVFYEMGNSEIIVNADIITISFMLLSRLEEYNGNCRDEYKRFKFRESILYKYGLISQPIVDIYAIQLKLLFEKLTATKGLKSGANIILTQDLDYIHRFSGITKSIRSIIGEIYFKGSLQGISSTILLACKSLVMPTLDPYFSGFKRLLFLTREYNLGARVYVMTNYLKSSKDSTILLLREMQNLFSEYNVTVGIHPDLNTYDNLSKFRLELEAFKNHFGFYPQHSRQHFLQIDSSSTFEIFDKLGVFHDSSLGFAEMEGFRSGTCHPYHPFNFTDGRPFNFIEEPLIVMDSTLKNYRRLNASQAVLVLMDLYKVIEYVGGNLILLWHNDTVTRHPEYTEEVLEFFLAEVRKS